MPVLGKNGAKNGLYMLWHHVLQPLVQVLLTPCIGLVLPRQCSWPHFVSTFELHQQVPSKVIIVDAGIGHVEHEGIDLHIVDVVAKLK